MAESLRIFYDPYPDDLEATPGKGSIPADICIVGIAPSKSRPSHRRNEPFGARSFQMLAGLLNGFNQSAKLHELLGKPLDELITVYMTNLSKLPVEKPKFTKRQLAMWYPLLMDELKLVRAKRILALGAAPAQVLCPAFSSLREDHGTLFTNPELEALVVPTFHFSAVARYPHYKSMFIRDIQRFTELEVPGQPSYALVSSHEEVKQAATAIDAVYLDIETTGLDPRKDEITMIGFKARGAADVQIIEKPTEQHLWALYQTFKATGATMVGHNLQFDLGFLEHKSRWHWDIPTRDTMLLAYTHGEESLSLKNLTAVYTDRPGSRALGTIADYGYLAEDVLSTEEIEQHFLAKDQAEDIRGTFAASLLNSLIPTTVGMQKRGVYIDYPRLCELRERVALEVDELFQTLSHELGPDFRLEHQPKKQEEVINWNSNDQVAEALRSIGIVLEEKTKAGKDSVAEATLLGLRKKYPHVRLLEVLLKYREKTKELGFYDNYLERTSADHPLLHPKLKLTGARTGRLSCVDPNLQQVPRLGPVKSLFVPRIEGGQYGLIDLSQAELRVVCMLADDDQFAEALMSGDVHRVNAAKCYKLPEDEVSAAQRKKVKGVTFGLLYGGSAAGLANRVGVPITEVEAILKFMEKSFPKLMKWLKRTGEIGNAELEIFTQFGRRRDLRSVAAMEGPRGVYRKSVNTPVQGLASDIALCILSYVADGVLRERLKSRPLFPVHDSVLGEIYPGEEAAYARVVQEAFRNLGNTPLTELRLFHTLPLEGELIVGNGWAQCESTSDYYDKEHNRYYPCSSLNSEILLPEPMGVFAHGEQPLLVG